MRFWQPVPKSDYFDYLKPYKFILVVGPQRAGTTIVATMIANDLDYDFLEESNVWGYLGRDAPPPGEQRHWQQFFDSYPDSMVIHCPEHTAFVHQYARLDCVAVVLVRRKVKDIIASQQRVGWGFEWLELLHYPGYKPPIAKAKYHFWDTYQKRLLKRNGFEVIYEKLKYHPMWVDKCRRRNFTITQVQIDRPRGPHVQNETLINESRHAIKNTK